MDQMNFDKANKSITEGLIVYANETNFETLFEEHPSPILIVDPENGEIIDANLNALQFYRYTKEVLQTMKIFDLNTLPKKIIIEKMKMVNKNINHFFYFKHKTSHGEIKNVKVNSIPVKIGTRNLLYSIITDLSEINLHQSFFSELFNRSPYAIAIYDENYKIIDANFNFIKLFKYELNELKGKMPKEVIYPEFLYHDMSENIDLIKKKGLIEKETIRMDKYGNIISVELISYPIFNNQKHKATYAFYKDITEKKAFQERIELQAKVLENNTEGIMITNSEAKVEWVNMAFTKITGFSYEEVVGKNPRILKSGKNGQSFYEKMWHAILTEGKWSGEIWNRNKWGEIYPQWLKIFTIEDKNFEINHYVAIMSDASEKKHWEERIENLIFKDSLTGLYNRLYMKDRIDREIQHASENNQQLAILFCDIDDFKNINDNLGHTIGDLIIQKFATKLNEFFPKESIIGRIGGDEFITLIPGIDHNDKAKLFAQEFLDALREPFMVKNQDIFITSSFGLSFYPENGTDAETLIKNADIAMYKAKENKNRIEIYHDLMKSNIEEQFVINNNLNNAIQNQELMLHYQPIINLKNMEIIGAEALIRWKHPRMGNISPDKFIPIAERSGPIHAIGIWVLTEACRQNKEWQQKGLAPIVVSVNISVKQLEEDYFAQMVSAILKETSLDPFYLELEITESVSAGNLDKIIINLKQLKKMGIKISMDDFGTGYSSLGKIKELEISKLKIDKSFISDMNLNSSYTEIVLAVLAMAKKLNLQVVSEGIETSDQLKFLIDNHCDLGQGYYFSKPLESDEFETYYRTFSSN